MEKKSKKDILSSDSIDDMIDEMLSFYSINEYKPILKFAEEDIDLSDDVSSARARLDLSLTPYLIEPLTNAVIEQGKRKIITVAMPEQMGKTTLEMVSIMWNCCYNKMQVMVVYPSLEKSIEMCANKFLPLFKKIPQFQADLKQPRSIKADKLTLANCVLSWKGGGTKIVGDSCKMTVGDECAVWDTPKNINNMAEMLNRTRSYFESLSIFVSTPTYEQNPHWRQWQEGSQGYFYLRCPVCKKHTIRSCDIHCLQFEKKFSEEQQIYIHVKSSCRLVCPDCHAIITEDKKDEMVQNGIYIHTYPERLPELASFQAGVLASLQPVHKWDNIAAKQMASGSSADYMDQVRFDNSFRGLPFQGERTSIQKESVIAEHLIDLKSIKPEEIEAIYCIADTQDEFSVVGVFALDIHNNYYLIDLSRPKYLHLDEEKRRLVNTQNREEGKPPETTVLDLLNKEYFGIKPLMCLIDVRGHRTDEVKQFSRLQNNIVMYMGCSLKFDEWKPSETIPKAMMCDAKKFQSKLIWTLYFNKNKSANYLYLPNTLTDTDKAEILSVQKDPHKLNGGLFENWDHQDKVHDVFDVLKMFFAGVKISIRIFNADKFRFCKAECLKHKIKKVVDAKNSIKNTIVRKPLFGGR